jgi:hypothetical protein
MEEEDWGFFRLFPIIPATFATFHGSTCKQSKPQIAKATQNKLIQNANATLLLPHKKIRELQEFKHETFDYLKNKPKSKYMN